MAKIAGLMALGQGLTAAGEGIDRAFQYRMEQMRQQSLERLESRRLDIAESSAKSQNAYYDSQVKAGLRGDQMKMMERFSAEMDDLLAEAPDQQVLQMVQDGMVELAKSSAQGNLTDPQMMEEAVAAVFAQAAAAKEIYSGTKEDQEAQEKWLRKAERLVRRSHSQWTSVFGDEKPMTLLDFATALAAPSGANFGEAPAGEGLMSGFATATADPQADGVLDRARERLTPPPEEPGLFSRAGSAMGMWLEDNWRKPGSAVGMWLEDTYGGAPNSGGLMSPSTPRSYAGGNRAATGAKALTPPGLFGLPENQMPVPGPLNPDDPLQYAVDR